MQKNEIEEKIVLKKSGFLWRASYRGFFAQGKTTGRAYLNLVDRLYSRFQIADKAFSETNKVAEDMKTNIKQLKEKVAAEQKEATSLRNELFEWRARRSQAEESIEHTNKLRIENCRLIGENRELTKQINELTQRTKI